MYDFLDVIRVIISAFIVSFIYAITRGDKENVILETVIGGVIMSIILIIIDIFNYLSGL